MYSIIFEKPVNEINLHLFLVWLDLFTQQLKILRYLTKIHLLVKVMCGFSELGRSLVKEFQVSTREHNISNQMILNGCTIKNNAQSSMLVSTLDNKLKDPVFLLSMFLQTGFN